ncbi:hypothetical protein [Streptomyces sp. NPDC088762]|uniref:hypothetical protein n=1 Tax=Streptomyces sp. NPDC088762 TaxID=3365891 RepID=UPI0038106E3F
MSASFPAVRLAIYRGCPCKYPETAPAARRPPPSGGGGHELSQAARRHFAIPTLTQAHELGFRPEAYDPELNGTARAAANGEAS